MLEAARIPGLHLAAVSESFDAETEAAVKHFQAWVPLPVTGRVDRDVWAKLIAVAEQREAVDTTVGELVGASDAHDKKLDTGQEVGHRGWRQVTLHCTIHEFRGQPFPNHACYVRFTDKHGEASDSSAVIADGVLQLTDVWVPYEGEFHLFVESGQRSVDGGAVGTVAGVVEMKCERNEYITFDAVQHPGDSRAMTYQDAVAYGFTSTTGSDAGAAVTPDGVGFKAGISSSSSATDTHTYSQSDTVTVTCAGNGFTITQTT
jgi:peptidoglycan hydrolase-like protein with peptidoglycan-binding domain